MDNEQEMSREDIIHAKGFNMISNDYYDNTIPNEYKKIKVGVKSLEDAVLNLGNLRQCFPRCGYTDKKYIYDAIMRN